MNEKVRTLGDLKAVMVKHLGEEKGKKLYNFFMQSMAMQMLAQVRATAPKSHKWGSPGTPVKQSPKMTHLYQATLFLGFSIDPSFKTSLRSVNPISSLY